ncbi:MAG: hypothetical protein WDN01_22620 [Rhizomicrobium sp.]
METRTVKPQSAKIFARIAAEPGALTRVLQPFAVASLVPAALTLRSRAAGGSFVVAEFPGLESARARLLVAKLSEMPCVRRARLSKSPERKKDAEGVR